MWTKRILIPMLLVVLCEGGLWRCIQDEGSDRTSSYPKEDISKYLRNLKRTKDPLLKEMKKAVKTAKLYCNNFFTSDFTGFQSENFTRIGEVCPGKWMWNKKIQQYCNVGGDRDCWTLPMFTKLECPHYICDSGLCHGVSPNTTHSEVICTCEMSNFVDILVFTYCVSIQNSDITIEKHRFALPRCCSPVTWKTLP